MAIGGLGGKYISKFSPDCSKVGISRPDGCLAIYSGVVGGGCKLLHQFSPSTHLTALPTCLAWAGRQEGRKKKKRKSQENNGELNNSDLVAMGTTAGTVLVYSTMQGNMVTSFKTENNTRINSLVWTKSCNTIYAAGEDGSVSLFSIPKQSLITTFTHSPEPVHSLALNRKENLLAMGSRGIHVWDIPNNKVINSFTGHANPVTRLEILDNFLFSSSESERVVSVWSLDTSTTSTLRVNANVADMSVNAGEEEKISIGVLTVEGVMAVLTCSQTADKSGLVSQPLKSVRVKTGQGVTRTVTAVGMVRDRVSIAYGEGMDIAVEQMDVENIEQNTCLVREKVVKSGQTEGVTDVVTPKTDGKVVFLAPGSSLSTGKGKRKAEKADDDSLPVEERISLLSTDPSTPSTTTTPRTDTLAQLLAQGLHSNDPRILDSVLDRADMELIDNTVKKIPAEAVVPLVTVLQKYIKGRGMVNASHAKWLKAVLTIHTGYLVSVPDCRELLTPLYALLETRTQHYNQVLQLRGKLELLTRQTMDRQGDTVVDTEKQALLVYQDESSDELEDVIDDLLVPGSDTDDDWEEKEDDEMEGGEESDDSIEIVNGEGR